MLKSNVSNEQFQQAYQNHANRAVINWYCNRFSQSLDADELKNCGLRGLWKALSIHDPARAKLVTILGTCVKHECQEAVKFNQKLSRQCDEHAPIDEISNKYKQDLKDHVAELMHGVNKQTRHIIYMKFYENKTYEEIGKIYGVTKQRIQQIVSKTLKKIGLRGV